MGQYIPNVDESDVSRVLIREFSDEEASQARDMLSHCEAADSARVALAILKLSEGNLTLLGETIEVANLDYRDVLAYAETPRYMKEIEPGKASSADHLEDVYRSDKEQYLEWLQN